MASTPMATKKPARTWTKRPPDKTSPEKPEIFDEEDCISLEAPQCEECPAAKARSTPCPGLRNRPPATSPPGDLLKMKKELQERVRELELEMAGETACHPACHPTCDAVCDSVCDPGDPVEFNEASVEGIIIAMVKDLHTEIDTAYGLKQGLEADLEAMTNQLSKEQSTKAELQARVKLLEAKATLAEQLRQDLGFEKKKRCETARHLDKVASQLETVTEERDQLAEQCEIDAERMQEIQSDLVSLETKVLQLESAVVDNRRLCEALDVSEEKSHCLETRVQDYKGKFEAGVVEKNAIELDLATTHEVVRNQKEEVAELKDMMSTAHNDTAAMRAALKQQKAENANLVKSNKKAANETKTLNARLNTMQKELNSGKKALRDVHDATLQTKRRVEKQTSESRGRKNPKRS